MDEMRYLISDASKKVDVEAHVLRYWEEELGLSIPRNELGHRYYTEFHIRLFCQVKKLKDKGYQLKAIKNALQQVMGAEQRPAGLRLESVGKEQDKTIREAVSLLEQDIARTLQTDPRLKCSCRFSPETDQIEEKKRRIVGAGCSAESRAAVITQLYDYSRLETGAVGMETCQKILGEQERGDRKDGSCEEKQGIGHRAIDKEGIQEDERGNGKEKAKEVDKENEQSASQIRGDAMQDHMAQDLREKAEKDGRTDMKNKGKNRKKPSAWERRNGVVSSTRIKGEHVDGEPRKEEMRGVVLKQEEIVSRAVRREGAGKECVRRILGEKEEAGWEVWPVSGDMEGAAERTALKAEVERTEPGTGAEHGGRTGEGLKSAAATEKGSKSVVTTEIEPKSVIAARGSKSAMATEEGPEGVAVAGEVPEERAGGRLNGVIAPGEAPKGVIAPGKGPKGVIAPGKGPKGVIAPEKGPKSVMTGEVPEGERAAGGPESAVASGEGRESTALKIAEQEAAVTAVSVQESIADTALSPMTPEEKLEQFQEIMDHIIGKALEANNEKLSRDISRLVNEELVEEMADLMRIRDEREEERFRHLDEVIRSCQRDRLGKAEAAAARLPFFRKKRFARNGKPL